MMKTLSLLIVAFGAWSSSASAQAPQPTQERSAEQESTEREQPAELSEVEVFGTPNPDNLPGLGSENAPQPKSKGPFGLEIGPDYSRQPGPSGDDAFPDSDLESVQPVEVIRKPR